MTQKNNYLFPLAIIGLFFFSIGFALGINSYLMPVLKNAMHISGAASSLLLAATFIPFLLFGIPATHCIRLIGYKRTMALSFAIFAAAFALFILAAKQNSLTWFLIASFVSGAANAVLQASVNPYVTILGPLDSAARRISCMGISNKLAWPVTTLFITLVIGKGIGDTQLSDLYLPFTIIIAIFLLLGVIALLAPLPDVKAAGEDESDTTASSNSYADGKTSILQFPHLLLGCLALFLYVGVETISLATATGYAQSLGIEGDNYGFIPSVGMIVGYICGVIFIPRYLSQAAAMRICAIIALVGSIAVAVVPNPVFSVCCIFLMALGCSLMWPALWPLAMADLGKFTKAGSSLLTMAIAGGAVMPWVQGLVQDAFSYQTSYWVSVPCFLFILYYGLAGYKVR
ncbi:glucose/galactose MFS transporter [Prevotella sp. oral taxon 313]|uniref:MFS transporter n=1 Tax=Prevotella sp. oral taxon 313 TaxID=652722 RepID=UPI000D1E751D|nr:MFS transporter [Prevotella sp. oral taxon 313]PTL29980.1 glucose/galactose MFS transporter [Prevotella sp. oral taxon 313]